MSVIGSIGVVIDIDIIVVGCVVVAGGGGSGSGSGGTGGGAIGSHIGQTLYCGLAIFTFLGSNRVIKIRLVPIAIRNG